MAEIIPKLNRQTLTRMMPGEKRVARRFEKLLEDDYLVWYDIPLGKKRRYPDFIILHPGRGLLFLEVKDWKIDTIKDINRVDATILTPVGLVTKPHPLEQARQYAYSVVNILQRDPQLRQASGPRKGNLTMPYGWGCIFTNITRKQIEKAMTEVEREMILPDHLMIYKDEMSDSVEAEKFQERLWGMFNYHFRGAMTLPQIDRVRWHLFPEIRLPDASTGDIFTEGEEATETPIPEIIKLMDIQQEQLAKSLGDGHRVIHGVAGSGKTMILGYRCIHLAQAALSKPILVLTFNITLAARLRSFISSRGIDTQVQIYHFHDWCGQQLRTYHVDIAKDERPHYERQVEAVINAVDKGRIPRAQYGALLIDEGHDFAADWLKLISQMVEPETDSLLLLYDDAQSIYQSRAGLGFSLSSVGIKAQGRTTILRLNYRNTREILRVAYDFAKIYLAPHATDDDDQIPLVEPESAGVTGQKPIFKDFDNREAELHFALQCIKQWNRKGIPLKDIAILFPQNWLGDQIADRLEQEQVNHLLANSRNNRKRYTIDKDQVTLMSIHSSKGLEFNRVILIGIDKLGVYEDRIVDDARLLYVGMTRAKECLLMTSAGDSQFSDQLGALT